MNSRNEIDFDYLFEYKEDKDEPKTTRTRRNIKNTLRFQLAENDYPVLKTTDDIKETTDKILKVHGLAKDNFDIINKFHRLRDKNIKLNDESIDGNANKGNVKSIPGLQFEADVANHKLEGYDELYIQMKEDWGKKEAKMLSGLMYDYSLPIHDPTKLLIPYCWAFDASKIVFTGRPYEQLHSRPPKNIYSYVNQLTETIHYMSENLAGAIAVGTFFSDIAFVSYVREGVSLEEVRQNKNVRKRLENAMQSFVHSVNHLSRSATESPFTNLSIFDRQKLRSIFNEENMGWMFHIEKEIDAEYFYDYIEEMQDIFLNFFDKGDPENDGMPYRFPVVTLNLSKDENEKLDEASEYYLDKWSKLDIFRYNIFTSLGSRVASCCRMQNNIEMMELGSQVNSFGGSAISLGSHRVVLLNMNRIALLTKYKEKSDFFDLLNERLEQSAKILSSHKRMLKRVLDDENLSVLVKLGWIDLNKMFSTFGLIAIKETVDTFNSIKHDEELNIDEILLFINEKVKELSTKYEIIGNIEQVPGESMAVRLADVDKYLFGEEEVPYKLYSNQFVPLWEDATIFERMEIDGEYNQLFTGGGIVHFNLGERTTASQNKELIKFAIASGCEHFALNAIYAQCEDGHTSFTTDETCPVCGKKIVCHLTRVVGFFTVVENWSPVRREWEFPRRKFKSLPSVEEIDKEIEKIS